VVLVLVFMVSSTGIVIFQSFCSCSGVEEISLYVSPDTCEDNFHVHHAHNTNDAKVEAEEHNCHECTNHLDDCGCSAPEVKYIKLINQLIDEEVKFLKIQQPKIQQTVTELIVAFSENEELSTDGFYIDPPPNITSSLQFLIQIQQLKIPSKA